MRNLIYKLFVKYFLPKHQLVIGDYIKDLADQRYRVEALYYDTSLQSVVIAVDENGNLRSFVEKGIDKI